MLTFIINLLFSLLLHSSTCYIVPYLQHLKHQ